MLKIAAEIDADYVIFGEFSADGGRLQLGAHVLRVSPPKLSNAIAESGALDALPQIGAQMAWHALCGIENSLDASASCSADSSAGRQFVAATPPLRLDAFQYYVRGLVSADDESRLRDLRESAQLQGDWDDPPLALGRAYYAKRDCEPALQWFSKVSSSGPHAAEANFDSGVCYLLRNDPIRAESSFSTVHVGPQGAASGSGEEDPAVASNLGAALLRQARYKEAIADFERALRLDPGEPDYEFNEGLGKYLVGDWLTASQALREALRLAPNDAQIRALLIASLDHAGKADEASALRAQAPAVASAAAQDPAKEITPPRRDIAKLDPTSLARLARIRTVFTPGADR